MLSSALTSTVSAGCPHLGGVPDKLDVLAAPHTDRQLIEHEAAMSSLAGWENFYIIVGSSAGALTGLTFVVITLVAQTRRQDADQGIAAYNTPTVAHFGTVLLVCALLSAPWPSLLPPALLLGLVGLAGIIYSAVIVGRQRHVDRYKPVLEDWLWYAACPLVAYVALFVAAFLLPGGPDASLFATAGAMLLLLFIGIRNAWDTVTYLTVERFVRGSGQDAGKDPPPES